MAREEEKGSNVILSKAFTIVICLILAVSTISAFIGVAMTTQSQESSDEVRTNTISVQRSTGEFTSLSLSCTELDKNTVVAENKRFTRLSLPGMGYTTSVGKPQLPTLSTHIAVPNKDVQLEVTNAEYHEADVGLVYPAQYPSPDGIGAEELEFVMDDEAYSSDAFYPDDVVSIDYKGITRGVPFTRVGFNPVRYNPAMGIAKVYTDIDVKVKWNSDEPLNLDDRLESRYFRSYYDNTFSNWQGFKQNFENELDFDLNSPRGSNGCDYLIITYPSLAEAANTLADWKTERGIDTKVVDTTVTGNTSSDIRSYIRTAYNNWSPAPSYVLLLGDADQIPTNYNNTHSYHGTMTGTDLWYYTLDGSDYYADMFFGRIPVDTLSQANNYIGKIVDYEVEPPYNSGYYTNGTVAAYFQDSGDGYEDRRFVKTSEEIRDHLMFNLTYNVSRIYCTESSVDPTNYNDGDYANGGPLPPELLRSNGFAWDGGATDIKNHVDNGSFILQHRDHGARDGWGDPHFMIPEIGTLDNGDLLPIVFSVNCQTGWFDHETDEEGSSTSSESFCEEFIRKQSGGCVCAFGATRVSYSGYNDYMTRGWYDAVWPDFDPSQGNSTPMYRMGNILNYGKGYMANTWGDPWGYEELEFELFHVFGDPTMEIWTDEPNNMTVSHRSSYPFGTTQVRVNVSQDDALVTLVQDGKIIGRNYSSGGKALIDVNPLVGGVVNVTVTKHNFRPYRGNIIVPSGEHDLAVKNLDVPTTAIAGDTVSVNADIFNLGENDESNVELQLMVEGTVENSTTISSIASGSIEPVTLSWTPTFGGDYLVEMYAVPVTGENVTWNNQKNDTTTIEAYPDIKVDPDGYDFVLDSGQVGTDNLKIYNDGLADEHYEITTLMEGDSVLDEFPTNGSFDPAIWDTAGISGTPEVDDVGVNEPSSPYSMRLNGDGDTIPSVVYDTTTSSSIEFSFWYELGGGGESPESGDSLSLEYYTSGGSWSEVWSVSGDGTNHNNYEHVSIDITNDAAYHGNFQYRFVSTGSGSGYDDFFVDDVHFNYTIPIKDGWLQTSPYNGTISPLSQTNVTVIVNTTTLSPGYYQEDIAIASNDPDEGLITLPVTLTVLSGQHDLNMTDMDVEGDYEAGHTHWINGTVLNQGQSDEGNVEVQLLVDGTQEDSKTLSTLLSAEQEQVHFTWTPPDEGVYTLSLYAVPVSGENETGNNQQNITADVFSLPDIRIDPNEFEFALEPGQDTTDTLKMFNDGLAELEYEIYTLQGGDMIFDDFPTNGSFDPAIWDTANISGTPEVDDVGVNEPSAPYSMRLNGDGDTIPSVAYDTTASTEIGFSFWYELGGGGESPETGDELALEYYASNGTWMKVWSVNGDGTNHNNYEHVEFNITSSYAYHTNFQYRFVSTGSGSGYDDFFVDDIYFNYTVPVTDGWLQVNPETGVVPQLSSHNIDVFVNASTLDPGLHQANITIMSNDTDRNEIKIPVTLTIANMTTEQLTMQAGWEFVSSQLIPDNTSISAILEDPTNGISGSYDKVMCYDMETEGWKTFAPGRAARYNDLDTWEESMGIWIHMTADDTLTIEGYQPVSTSITLEPGWNMVGYPSGTDSVANDTLPSEVTKIGVFNPGMQYDVEYISDLTTYTMTTGEGYWVYNGADYDVEWNLDY